MTGTEKRSRLHKPVLVDEVIEALKVRQIALLKLGVVIVDATLGLGGHSSELLKRGVEVVGIEADDEMIKIAKDVLDKACPAPNKKIRGDHTIMHGNFKNLKTLVNSVGYHDVDGVLFDLGVSSPQLTSSERGFSFTNKEAFLDMRIDRNEQNVTARDLVNVLSKAQLIEVFKLVINYKEAKSIAARIVEKRQSGQILTVGQFTDIVSHTIRKKGKLDVATLPLMALRMAVNSELENLKEALPQAFDLIKKKGRIVVISFHSGEDRVVKTYFREMEDKGLGVAINKKPITPKDSEIESNPRSRSAKMRILEKL